MDSKTLLCASVTGTITPRDDKESEVRALLVFFFLTKTYLNQRASLIDVRVF